MNAEQTPARAAVTGAAGFIMLAALAGLLLYSAQNETAGQRERNAALHEARLLADVLPVSDIAAPAGSIRLNLTDEELLGSADALPAWPVYRDGKLAAIALTVVAQDGYVGPIRLLVGIDAAGEILAVRATAHRETPGLGDRIDTERSGWLLNFFGRHATQSAAVALRREGGDIDHISGATVTSRAVTNAVRKALEYFRLNRETFITPPPAAPTGD